jgi:hypothetical protein
VDKRDLLEVDEINGLSMKKQTTDDAETGHGVVIEGTTPKGDGN